MTLKPRVVVIEDEPDLRSTMVSFLNLSGFVTDGVGSRAEFDAWMANHDCDLVVLDLGLPDADGITLAQSLREMGDYGIVVITARSGIDDRLEGYEVGADHYMVKPVDLREVVGVVRAVHARRPRIRDRWVLDPVAWTLTAPSGVAVRLTRSELEILKPLAETPGEAVPRAALAEALGFRSADYDPRRMEIMVRRLRRKVGEATGLSLPVETVHAVGYAFTAPIQAV